MVEVDQHEQAQQQAAGQPHGGREGHGGPAEIDAAQKAQEQRRIAERGQGAADVAHQEDEEHEHMGVAAPVLVGADQRPYQQHGGAGRAEQTRAERAEPEDHEVGERRADQVAGDPDAAGHDEQGQQQQDEGQVFVGHGAEHGGGGGPQARVDAIGHEEQQRPERRDEGEPALPGVAGEQRQRGDREQQPGKGQRPDKRQRLGRPALCCLHSAPRAAPTATLSAKGGTGATGLRACLKTRDLMLRRSVGTVSKHGRNLPILQLGRFASGSG